MITKEMIELIRSTISKKNMSGNKIVRLEGLGDLWISLSNDKEIQQDNSTFYKIGSVVIDNISYHVFGRR